MHRIVVALAFACGMSESVAQLPLDKTGTMEMPAVHNRIYVGDVAISHIVNGRMHIVGVDTGKYLGLIGTGFAGQFTQSPDRRELYVAPMAHAVASAGFRRSRNGSAASCIFPRDAHSWCECRA